MDFIQSRGWQLLGKRYWFLSEGPLHKSIDILPYFTLHNVSRNCMALNLGQTHHGGLFHSDSGVVCDIVNFIVGCILFILSKNVWRLDIDPTNIKNKSSKKRFLNCMGMLPFSIYFSAISQNYLSTFLAIKRLPPVYIIPDWIPIWKFLIFQVWT